MSSSLVSGPYASAVSIRFTPSSTARLRTFSAFCLSLGQPQIPSPVMRIAPKPSRLTVESPPKAKVGFVAMFKVVEVSAPRSTSDFPAKSAAPLARLIPINPRRVRLRSRLAVGGSFFMTRGRTFMKTVFKARRWSLSFAHYNVEGLFEIFPESDNPPFVAGHDEKLSTSHIAYLEQANDFVRHFRRAITNAL